MRRIEAKLRLIERIIEGIYNPQIVKQNQNKIPRGILQNSKVKEAINLYDKVAEAQRLIDLIDDQQAHYVYQEQLNFYELQRQQIICPYITIVCETEEDMS